MTPGSSTPRTLSTAGARRETVLETAATSFARRGLLGTPTTEVAKAAGISQAYLFRLFPTKTDLAVAVMQRCHERIASAFEEAAQTALRDGADPLDAMGEAYRELLRDRDQLLLQLHGFAAAAGDPALRDTMRAGFRRLYDVVAEYSGAGEEEISSFFASGMLLNVMAAMDAFELDEPWARAFASPKDP
jgi:AcrR family transcriptional regulator